LIFVSLIGILASLNLFKAFKQLFSDQNNILIFSCFFMPSVIFWTSGFHKDVWVYLGMSYLILAISNSENLLRKRYFLVGILIISIFRFHLFLLLLPLLFAHFWSLSESKISAFQKYLIFNFFFVMLVSLLEFSGVFSILGFISDRQVEFLNEYGESNIENAMALEPTFIDFIIRIPSALMNVCFRPFIWDCKDFLQLLAALEILGFWLLMIISIFYKKIPVFKNPVQNFITFYFLLNFLMIGLLVSNVGTIVRYRAIALGLMAIFVFQALVIVRKGITNFFYSIKPLSKTSEKSD
jgi:hypothetical protein